MLTLLAIALHSALFLVFVLDSYSNLYLVDPWADDEDRSRLERNTRRYFWAYALLLMACALLDILLWHNMLPIWQLTVIGLGALFVWRLTELARHPSDEDTPD